MWHKTVIIVQARTASKRLPNKSIRLVAEKPLLVHLLDRLLLTRLPIIVAVPVAAQARFSSILATHFYQYYAQQPISLPASPSPNKIAAQKKTIRDQLTLASGSEEDVLGRFVQALSQYNNNEQEIETIIRVTADNPFISIQCLLALLNKHCTAQKQALSYFTGLPYGTGVEIIQRTALVQAAAQAKLPADREHVTSYLYARPQTFAIKAYSAPQAYYAPKLRLTVDTLADFKACARYFKHYQPTTTQRKYSCTPPLRAVIPLQALIKGELRHTIR